ncbi:hypothetical protein MPSEU_000204900 [Mayamaea pseudoterrestris]|nr:hypothetical protein MPSEU_000204900 [Mayamaea pseudoterrestris]
MSTTAAVSCEPLADEWPTSSDQYNLLGKIGVGAFATVYRATTNDDRDCAIKVLNLDHVDTNLAEIRLEVQAMRLSSHPNVLCCHAAFVHEIQLWLVTQLMRKGSSLHCLQTARRFMQSQQRTCLMEPHIFYILHETLLGLKYIHDNNTLHRDIKACNILLDHDGSVRIADFGVSGWLVQGGSAIEKAKTFVGTPCWMAPEVMEQVHGYDYVADIWSLGITALELAKGFAPYAKFPPMKVLILTIQEDPPNLDSYMDDDADGDELVVTEEYTRLFQGFVEACLQKNPAKRPTCQDLLHSKYMIALQDETTRRERRGQLRRQVCDVVPDVGEASDQTNDLKQARHATVSFVFSQETDRAPGTTWVFADGSQVLSTAATSRLTTIDDVMAELDAFGELTGGEHYDRNSAKLKESSEEFHALELKPSEEQEQEDDLDAFMDEFEQQTGGENFQRS